MVLLEQRIFWKLENFEQLDEMISYNNESTNTERWQNNHPYIIQIKLFYKNLFLNSVATP